MLASSRLSMRPLHLEVGSLNETVATLQGGGGQTVYVDGVNDGDGGGGTAFSASTNMDAIEEVNVQMSAYTAEYGLKGGA